jgi:hypothetical protein
MTTVDHLNPETLARNRAFTQVVAVSGPHKVVYVGGQDAGLMDAYRARPPYQQNDYLGWIGRGKREDTRRRRLDQMLDELEGGDRYMKMRWSGGTRPASPARRRSVR